MPVQWLVTAPTAKYRHKTHGADDGQRGWLLHAVIAENSEMFAEIASRTAACGLRPSHGWSLDLFIERRCARCEAALQKGEHGR